MVRGTRLDPTSEVFETGIETEKKFAVTENPGRLVETDGTKRGRF